MGTPVLRTCRQCGETKPTRYRELCDTCYGRLRYRRLAAAHGGTPPVWLEASRRRRARGGAR